jgi:hypothetical protein
MEVNFHFVHERVANKSLLVDFMSLAEVIVLVEKKKNADKIFYCIIAYFSDMYMYKSLSIYTKV